ncbi:MAG: M12 family metallo-peptidase [Planctomycetota bacterium]|nr:M12 family metallo-peptidase [Planctomycetota bacterium]
MKTPISTICLFVLLVLSSNVYATLSDGIVGYWPLDDIADNTTVLDLSGYGNHGTSSLVGLAVLSKLCPGQVIQSQLPTGIYESLLKQTRASEVSVQSLQFRQDPNEEIVVSVQLGQQREEIVLYPFSVRSLAFAVYIQDHSGALSQIPVGPSCSYRGYIRGIDNSRISATMLNGRLFADIYTGQEPENNYSIKPADGLAAELNVHLVYRQNDVAEEPGVCGVDTQVQPAFDGQIKAATSISDMDIRICEIACDADNEYYVAKGQDPNAVIADIETVINGVSFIYEMDTQVTFEITQIIIRTDDASDPYTSTNSSTLLNQLKTQWQTNHGDIQRDMVHLFTGKTLENSIVGRAFLDGVCLPSQYSLSKTTFSTELDKRIAVAAHEIAHVIGADHCDGYDNGCRIMCSSLDKCSGGYHSFGPTSIQTLNARKTISCLSDGTISVTSLELPFADDFSYGSGGGSYYLDSARWIEADKAMLSYGRLELTMRKGYDGYIMMGTARTRPINIDQPALISYKVSQNNILNNWYLKVEYLDAALKWKTLNSIRSDGVYSTTFKTYQHLIPTDGRSHFFALRLSADGSYQSSSFTSWRIDDVSIIAFAPDIDEDGDVDLGDFAAIAAAWNTQSIDPGWNPQADLSSPPDGNISFNDLMILSQYWLLGK